uniref:Uncharacterized protein n=1 Tax=Brassica campestris TaxID=3711 RepID=M4DF39_BRACM
MQIRGVSLHLRQVQRGFSLDLKDLGIDSQCFRFKKDVCSEGEEEDGVPYGYGFFHFVFATGGMYFAMQLIGWNTHHPMKNMDADGSNRAEDQKTKSK